MCGIAGFAGAPVDRGTGDARLRAMCDAIRHRGPDDDGREMVADGVGLGMRRLAIIDVSGGHQPISNEDDSVVVVFNGEIYNHHALRDRLRTRGHQFKTKADTETLVHLWEDDGEGMVHALRGMFTFAIWDKRREVLFAARDRLGIKPLYYCETAGGGVAFASELRAFLALPDFPRTLDRSAIATYLALGYVADPQCVFEGVRKLPPGHALRWDRANGIVVTRYWTPVRDETPARDEREVMEELRRLLHEAVESHLESEVPLGAFLSGGIDSSTVVACMARAMDRPVQTFSIGFDDEDFNEAPHAAAVAKALGTDHTELVLRPDADALVDDVIRGFDEPFSDASALPTYVVAQLARQRVTVALSGDGGDELFSGYTRYAEVLGRGRVPSGTARRALRVLASSLPHATPGRNRLLDLARTRRGQYATTVAFPLAPDEGGAARRELARAAGSLDELLTPWFEQASTRDFATQMSLVDLMTYLPGDILTKVDRMTMAVSLEARVPLLDHLVVEFAVSLPSRLKLQNGGGKWILKRAIEGLVPPQVLEKRKQGFGVPLHRWFRNELRHRVDALLSPGSPIYEFADPDAVQRTVSEHLRGRRNHQGRLWRLMVLDGWLKALGSGQLARAFTPSDHLGTVVEQARTF